MTIPGRPRVIGRRGLLAGAGGLLAAPAVVRAQRAAGAALVIGNSKYQWEAQLPNVRRDAPDIARAFQGLGLKTDLVQDVGRDAMMRAIAKFRSEAQGANFAAVYFAGHGASWARNSYIVPVDTDLSDPSTVKSLIQANEFGIATKEAAHRLVVFDNCRNNPADGWRQLEAERAAYVNPEMQRSRIEHQPNNLVMFSTAPGRVALDGPAGQNSPFAASLLRQFASPSVDIQSMPSKVRRDLLIATDGRQVMWDRNGYDQPFVLTGAGKSSAPPASGGDPSRIVELPNAYGYAQQNELPLPSGLIGERAAGNSPNNRMIGSFKYLNPTPLGPLPALLVVLSVDQGQTAQIILATKGVYNAKHGKMEGGAIWRFVTANVSGDRLEFVPRDQAARMTFSWSDANSGRLNALGESNLGGGRGNASSSTSFTRLDG